MNAAAIQKDAIEGDEFTGEATRKATRAWGSDMPDWVRELALQCDATSQVQVAGILTVSSTQVSRVLGKTYAGNLNKVAERVRGQYLALTVECPVLETISRQRCIAEQDRPFSVESPQRIAVYKACRKPCRNLIQRGGK